MAHPSPCAQFFLQVQQQSKSPCPEYFVCSSLQAASSAGYTADSPAARAQSTRGHVAPAHVNAEIPDSEDDEEKGNGRILEHDRVGLLRPRPGE